MPSPESSEGTERHYFGNDSIMYLLILTALKPAIKSSHTYKSTETEIHDLLTGLPIAQRPRDPFTIVQYTT